MAKKTVIPHEKTTRMVVHANAIQHVLRDPTLTIEQAAECVPDLTLRQLVAIRNGTAHVEGDSEHGIQVVLH